MRYASNQKKTSINSILSLIALATIMIVGSIVAFQTAPPLKQKVTLVDSSGNYDIEKHPNYTDKILDPVSILTLFLVVSTVLLWIETRRLADMAVVQSRDTRKSVRIARRAAKAATQSAAVAERAISLSERSTAVQLRAYVGYDDITMEPIIEGSVIQINVFIKNFGATPAMSNRVVFTMRPIGADQIDNIAPPDTTDVVGSVRTLMQNSQTVITLRSSGPSSARLIELIESSTYTVGISGEIFYKDIFGVDHNTSIRMFYNAAERAFRFSGNGNEAY